MNVSFGSPLIWKPLFRHRPDSAERGLSESAISDQKADEQKTTHISRSGPSYERPLRSCRDHRLNGYVGRTAAVQMAAPSGRLTPIRVHSRPLARPARYDKARDFVELAVRARLANTRQSGQISLET
jgi:hypothetical protein